MTELLISFKHKNFPFINVYQDYFEIKARDHWEFRSFNFNEVKKIRYYNPNDNWWTPIALVFTNPYMKIFSKKEYFYIRVYKNNGGYWNYITPELIDKDLVIVLKNIEKQSGKIIVELPKKGRFENE